MFVTFTKLPSCKEVEELLATQSGGYQTIRIETPIIILGAEVVDKKDNKK